MKKWGRSKTETLISILYIVMSVAVLAFSLLTINEAVKGGAIQQVYLFFVFLSLSFSRGLLAIYFSISNRDNKIAFFKCLFFGTLYFVLAVLILALFKNPHIFRILSCVYLISVIANRMCLVFEVKKTGRRVFNIILAVLSSILLLVLFAADLEAGVSYILLLLFIVIIVSFIEVFGFAFSKIKLKGLFEIIRKTYVLEILYGLVILMISFSFYFMVMEEDIKTVGDGLWFSFSIITTIGLGDYTVKTFFGRVLAVILGVYGLVVVASITSVIVNYYNEIKTNEKDDEKENKETKEDDNKQEDNK